MKSWKGHKNFTELQQPSWEVANCFFFTSTMGKNRWIPSLCGAFYLHYSIFFLEMLRGSFFKSILNRSRIFQDFKVKWCNLFLCNLPLFFLHWNSDFFVTATIWVFESRLRDDVSHVTLSCYTPMLVCESMAWSQTWTLNEWRFLIYILSY